VDAPQPNLERPVFLDESGDRFRRMQRLGALVVAGAVLLAILFAATVFRAPTLSKAPLTPHASDRFPPRVGSIKTERRLFASIARDEAIRNRIKPPVGAPAQIMGAYFAPWEPDAFVAFRAHASELTHVYPAWLQLTADGGGVSSEDWTPGSNKGTGQLTTAARAAGVKIVPVVGNAANETFDRARLTALAQSPAKQQAVLKALTDFVDSKF
jgi:hypothetical protein